jgi:peptidoglycan/xylan/chitin deacetylase (PgdA/CDA1 family)
VKPRAPLSLDLDNKWSYLKTHGDDSWRDFPSYLDYVVPRILAELDRRDLQITFFIVGKDAEDPANREVLASIAASGHEIANHSYLHEPWLHLYSDEDLRDDLSRAHEAIAAATTREPRGFRGPGFSLSSGTVHTLSRLGYRYDATAFPNVLNPIGRAYYFRTSNLSAEEREQRKALFGTIGDAMKPNRPYAWALEDGTAFIEVPVTTMPGVRVPMHFSYLLYLGGYSSVAARAYFEAALRLCRVTRTQPSLLMHPLDFLGGDDEPDLAFFPGMAMEYARKRDLMSDALDTWQRHFDTVTVGDFVSGLPQWLPTQPLRFKAESSVS